MFRRHEFSWRLAILLNSILDNHRCQAITRSSLSACAQTCFANAVIQAPSCESNDTECLCQELAYGQSLSCCLGHTCNTQEQEVAIIFYQQTCSAAIESSATLVRCSSGNSSTTSTHMQTASPSTNSNGVLMPTSSTSVLTQSISSGERIGPDSTPTPSSTSKAQGAPYTGQALLTGSCSVPSFAQVKAMGIVTEFPQVGCASGRKECCPSTSIEHSLLTKCPQDYFTTLSGCCPSGYRVLSSQIGIETPCFSYVAAPLTPGNLPATSQVTLISDRVFASRYPMVEAKHTYSPSDGVVVGIVSGVLATLLGVAILARKYRCTRDRATTNLQVDKQKLLQSRSFSGHAHQLQAKASTPLSSSTPFSDPSPGTIAESIPWLGPTSSLNDYSRDGRSRNAASVCTMQELPADTYINQHHPAFSRQPLPTISEVSFTNCRSSRSKSTTAETGSSGNTPSWSISSTTEASVPLPGFKRTHISMPAILSLKEEREAAKRTFLNGNEPG